MSALSLELNSYVVGLLEDLDESKVSASERVVRKIERNTGKKSSAVVVRKFSQEEFFAALEREEIFESCYEHFLSLADSCVRARIAAGAEVIRSTDYDLQAICASLTEVEISLGRVSKEKIELYWTNCLQPHFISALQVKFSGSLSNDLILQSCVKHKNLFAQLSKKEGSFAAEICSQLEKVLNLPGIPDSAMLRYLKDKLKTFAPKSADLLGL